LKTVGGTERPLRYYGSGASDRHRLSLSNDEAADDLTTLGGLFYPAPFLNDRF